MEPVSPEAPQTRRDGLLTQTQLGRSARLPLSLCVGGHSPFCFCIVCVYSIGRKGEKGGSSAGSYIEVSHSLALCLLAFLWSSGRGGMGYGYLLLDAMDPVEEVGDLAGDNVSVELERARNFFPFSFLRLPLRFPCHELLLGRPFSQISAMCLASGILSLQEWDRPLDLFLELQPELVLTPGGMSL